MPHVNEKCGWVFWVSMRSRRMIRPRKWVSKGGGKFKLITGKSKILLTWVPRYGLAVTGVERWSDGPIPHFVPDWTRGLKWMKKKKVKGDASGSVHSAAMESTLFSGLHSLVAHCATTRYEDGDQRQVGWITITTQGPTWRVTVKDPDSAASFVVTAPTLDEALTMASLLLEADDAPWAHDKWLAKGAKKK